MINRQNWLDTCAYLEHLQHDLGRTDQTIHAYRIHLRRLLEWADEKPLSKANHLDPVFPVYLAELRTRHTAPLTYSTLYKTLTTVRLFYAFAMSTWNARYQHIHAAWLATLRPRSQPEPRLEEHRFYTRDELLRIASVSTETLREERGQAAACMLFLSGMRPDAFASMPRRCVDLANNRLLQIPSLGIRTKNKKAAVTYLLNIPELRAIVQRWECRVAHMAEDALWYAPLHTDDVQLIESRRAIQGRASLIGEDIRIICSRAGVEYKSPHKFRHGHIVYARSLARTLAEAKAISQNVMHANTIITDQVYSALTGDQVRDVITSLGTDKQNEQADLLRLLEELKQRLLTSS